MRRWLVAVAVLATAWCTAPAVPPESLDLLRLRVAALQDSASGVALPVELVDGSRSDSADVVIGLSTPHTTTILARAAERYLTDVSLHLRLDERVSEGDEVKIGVGPVQVTAGHWNVVVTIERVDARLGADSVTVGVADSLSLSVSLPVRVYGGSGDAHIVFTWDAAIVAGLVCGDFEVEETLTGVIEPRTYLLEGSFVVESRGPEVVARPVLDQRITAYPVPTDESWARVRELLEEQDRVGNCGLAISADDLEERLRRLVAEGFDFRFPSSILPELPLPARIAEDAVVAGRRLNVTIRPAAPRLTEEWIWLGAQVSLEGG